MLVKDKMKKSPVTVGKKETLVSAARLMHEKNVRHLPIMDDGRLLGVLSFTDIMRAMPSNVSNLEEQEANSLFNSVRIQDALPERQKLITVKEDTCIEEAALIMRSYKISCLPVLDPQGKLVGLFTENDIFDSVIDLLGVRSCGSRISINIGGEPGIIAEITSIIKSFNANITKIGMIPRDDSHYRVIIRLQAEDLQAVLDALTARGYQAEALADARKPFSTSSPK
ncbi:MAG: CBS and ACT domain-containing protein [Bacillota bacterium]|nr:CBS and ACT domain-containing protein [Bacillota bacterium]